MRRILNKLDNLFEHLGSPPDYGQYRNSIMPKQEGGKLKKESTVDFPREVLSSDVWEKDGNEYKLKSDLKDRITNLLNKYPKINLLDIADEVRIVGSIGTNQYADDADVDIHVAVGDESKLPEGMTPEEWVKDVFKFYRESEDAGFVGEHPLEVYLQLNPDQDLMSDAVYDLKADKWVKGPKVEPLDLDPYEVFDSIFSEIQELAGEADVELGELRRDVIDYDVIKKAAEELPAEYKTKLIDKLNAKLKEIEDDIRELMATKLTWHDMRKSASLPDSPEQALSDVEMAKKWKDKNAIFKFLNRYEYLRLIKDLGETIEDDKVEDSELEKIRDLLSIKRIKKETQNSNLTIKQQQLANPMGDY